MKRPVWPLIVAVLLMVVGLAGTIAGAALTSALRSTSTAGIQPLVPSPGTTPRARGNIDGFTSNGQRIFYTGVGHNGPIAFEWDPQSRFGGMMRGRGQMGRGRIRGMACVMCHGADGRGGPLGMMDAGIDVPDIRYSTLTSPGEDATGTVPGWSDAQIADVIRTGVEPDGEELNTLMPRWDMDATDMKDTIDYLKELSQ